MNPFKAIKIGLWAAAVAVWAQASGTAATSLTLMPESRVFLSGSSTLHPYASTSTLTHIDAVLALGNDAEATAPAAIFTDIARRAPFQTFDVSIPVKGLKSGESGLDKNMYKALKMGDAPEIHFVMTHYETTASGSGSGFPFNAAGSLAIAGAQRDVALKGTAQPSADRLIIDGQYDLRMSDYGIKPPALLLGTIKVADPVVIHFHLVFELTKGALQ